MVRTNELVAERKRHNKTQQDMADFLNCSKNTYSLKENNIAKFDIDEALKICDFLKIDSAAQRAYIFLA